MASYPFAKPAILLFCAAAAAFPQSAVPTISSISISAVDHASANIQFSTSTGAWVQLRYGVQSGKYIYTSASVYGTAAFSLGGLAPATTYYVLPTARPDRDDDTNICATVDCGAVEQSFTTEPLPPVHPSPPKPPATWTPVEPDTTSYTVIPMQVGATGECVASRSIPQQPGWSSAVTAGDNIQVILGKIFYGTVIEFPQGAVCKVIQVDAYFHVGYPLPLLSLDPNAGGDIDSPNHRWIVFRTQSLSAADFPPYGVRTGPQWAAKLAKLEVQTPGNPTDGSAPGLGVLNLSGQLFQCYGLGCHHFWFENMEWTHAADASIYPAGLVDPPAFGPYIWFTPNSPDVGNAAITPNYNVLDRIYAHGQPWPSRELAIFAPGGNHWAIVNCWAQANMWTPGVTPQSYPSMQGSLMTIPQATYQLNSFDNTPIGMRAQATAQWNVPADYNGVFYAWIDAGGLTIDYQTAPGASVACSGCTAVSEASPWGGSVPRTSMWYFNGHFSNGSASLDNITAWSAPSTLAAWKPMGIYPAAGNFATVDNNYIEAIGQTVYNDISGPITDLTWTHNYFYFPRSKMQNSGAWDGYGYSFRNIFETKQATRWLLAGNIFDGAAAYQNPGNPVLIGSAYGESWATGAQDIEISNNIFRHISAGFQCAGGGAQQPPDAPVTARIEVFNNLWLDLNRDLYNNGGGGLMSGPFSTYPGCEDVNIHRNTVDLTLGSGPALLEMGTASNGQSVMGEGLNFSDNEMHLSLNELDVFFPVCGQITPSHPAVPSTMCWSSGTSWEQMLNTSFMNAGAAIAPSWTITNNVIIGGQTKRGNGVWTDIDQNTMNTIAAGFPAGNIFPAGATMAARRAAVNWDPITYRIVPSAWNAGNIGADVDSITAASGTVANISIVPSADSVQISYTAPDSRACYADVSPDGVSWTRFQDGGATSNRVLTIGSLTSGVVYNYRLMCYSDQSAQYEYLPGQITSGSFRTGGYRRGNEGGTR